MIVKDNLDCSKLDRFLDFPCVTQLKSRCLKEDNSWSCTPFTRISSLQSSMVFILTLLLTALISILCLLTLLASFFVRFCKSHLLPTIRSMLSTKSRLNSGIPPWTRNCDGLGVFLDDSLQINVRTGDKVNLGECSTLSRSVLPRVVSSELSNLCTVLR